MSVTLRGWQVDARERVLDGWGPGLPGRLVVACTGAGKTVFGLATVLPLGGRVVWLAHREELLDAPMDDVRALWPELKRECGIVQGDRDQRRRRVVFASEPTLRNRARRDGLRHPDVLVVDEAHHSPSPAYSEVIADLVGPNTRVLGLTATADRADAKDLAPHWQIVAQYGILDAVRDGVLLPPYAAVDAVPGVELLGLEDLDDHQQAEALIRAEVVAHTVAAMDREHDAEELPFRDRSRRLTCRGRQGLVFTATVAQAELTAAALREAGWRADTVSGETDKGRRRRLLKQYKAGEIDVLCNAAVLTEGTNLPTASFAVLARACRSWPLYVQTLGRALRTMEGKPEPEALILDLTGATRLHSLVGAPVLIGAEGCPSFGDGRHRYQDDGDGGGICECGAKVSCVKRQGPHLFKPGTTACASCGAPRCGESPDGHHMWRVASPTQRECCWCGCLTSSPLAGLISGGQSAPEEVAWRPVRDGLYGVELDGVGACFVRQVDGGFMPYLVRAGSNELQPLVWQPVDRRMVRALTDDVARRARLVAGKRGGAKAEWQRRKRAANLERLAQAVGL